MWGAWEGGIQLAVLHAQWPRHGGDAGRSAADNHPSLYSLRLSRTKAWGELLPGGSGWVRERITGPDGEVMLLVGWVVGT